MLMQCMYRLKIGANEYTPQNPGALKDAIAFDFNSVGACVGGQVTFEGYVDIAPYSATVQFFAAKYQYGAAVPDAATMPRIALGIVGIPTSTISETGKRTTTIPIVGIDALDRDGLAVLGLGTAVPELGVGSGVTMIGGIPSPLEKVSQVQRTQDALGLTVETTVLVDPPYGETVDTGFKRVFGSNALTSWGVRPDGARVAGIPSPGEAILSTADNVFAQPANYELTGYLSEFVERPGERWAYAAHARGLSSLIPRRGASVNNEALLGDSQGGLPVDLFIEHFDNQQSTYGRMVGVVPLRSLVAASYANPQVYNATAQYTGMTFSVEVTFDHPALDAAPPDRWHGQNVYALGTWQDNVNVEPLTSLRARLDQGPAPRSPSDLIEFIRSGDFPLFTTTQDKDSKTITAKDLNYFSTQAVLGYSDGGITGDDAAARQSDFNNTKSSYPDWFNTVYPQKLADASQQQWSYYLSQIGVNVSLGEWFTTSSAGNAIAAAYQSAPEKNTNQPTFPPYEGNQSQYGTIGYMGYVIQKLLWQQNPENYQASNAQYALDPKKDPGIIRGLYLNTVRLDTGQRRVLTWTFTVQKELLAQLDPTLGGNYNWAFALTYSGIRLGTKARARVISTTLYAKKMLGTTNIHRDLPAYETGTFSTPTLQGYIEGDFKTGPFTVDGQQMVNAKIVIDPDGQFRTTFQTGSPTGGK